MEDLQIVALYWAREEAAIRESDVKYGRMLAAIAYNILQNREDGEECVNDTYSRAWNAIPPQRPHSLAAYLGRITRNLSINKGQARRAQKRDSGGDLLLSELSECLPSNASVEAKAEEAALVEVLNRWLFALPQEDRILFLRRYWFGDSLAEVAASRATSPNKLAGKLYRLRQKLKTTLEKEGVFL